MALSASPAGNHRIAGRQHVRNRGTWIFAAILVTGLVPSILYNLLSDFAPIRYYLETRHDTVVRFAAVGEFLVVQAGLATPLLFLALLSALATALVRARERDSCAQLISVFALLPLGVFLIASPFESSRLATHHWPMPAYIPLLLYLPLTYRAFVAGDSHPRLRRGLALLAPGLAAVLLLLAGIEFATGYFGTSVRRPFVGWSEIAAAVERHLEEVTTRGQRSEWIVVADNYKLGANLEFETGGRVTPFVLNHEKNRQHGRAPQFRAWHLGEAALHENAGKNAIVVIQVKEVPSSRRAEWRESVARRFEHFERHEEVRVKVGGRSVRFEVIRARGLRRMP